ncbi:carboxypeptidase regulatory-like domain-containing protein [bacterium]|nr:carboxypeptidase regulatory-like domain-containing protein [bacterium]
MRQTLKNKSGFTFIESLVLLFIFSTIAVTFYSVFNLGTRHIIESKNRLGAVSLANQKMEIIRNLNYSSVGTISGIPSGSINADEYETVNTRNFHILTDIKYCDDSFDGTQGGSTDDAIPNDYKIARVTIKWGEETASQQVYLVATFAPPGVETSAGGGTLRINIIDSGALGIADASIHLHNAGTGVDLNTVTDSTGSVLFPGTPAGSDYEIDVSKNEYESVSTLAVSPASPYNPVTDEHASVIADALNVKSIIVNLISDINIATVDSLGNAVGDITFKLTGGRILGTKVSDGEPGYNYEQDLAVDSSGEKSISNVSPGIYEFMLRDASNDDFAFIKMDPGDDTSSNKFTLSPGITMDVKAIVADKSVNSLLVSVNDDGGSAVEGAEARLKNDGLGYDITLTTDKYGKVYFPDASGPLQNDTYDLTISATGFNSDYSANAISGLVEKDIVLTAT